MKEKVIVTWSPIFDIYISQWRKSAHSHSCLIIHYHRDSELEWYAHMKKIIRNFSSKMLYSFSRLRLLRGGNCFSKSKQESMWKIVNYKSVIIIIKHKTKYMLLNCWVFSCLDYSKFHYLCKGFNKSLHAKVYLSALTEWKENYLGEI